MLVRTTPRGASTHSRGRGRAYTAAGVRVRTLPRVRGLGQFLELAPEIKTLRQFKRYMGGITQKLYNLVNRELEEGQEEAVKERLSETHAGVTQAYHDYILRGEGTVEDDQEAAALKSEWDNLVSYFYGQLDVGITPEIKESIAEMIRNKIGTLGIGAGIGVGTVALILGAAVLLSRR